MINLRRKNVIKLPDSLIILLPEIDRVADSRHSCLGNRSSKGWYWFENEFIEVGVESSMMTSSIIDPIVDMLEDGYIFARSRIAFYIIPLEIGCIVMVLLGWIGSNAKEVTGLIGSSSPGPFPLTRTPCCSD